MRAAGSPSRTQRGTSRWMAGGCAGSARNAATATIAGQDSSPDAPGLIKLRTAGQRGKNGAHGGPKPPPMRCCSTVSDSEWHFGLDGADARATRCPDGAVGCFEPSERVLAEEHAASRTTVRLVLLKLSAQGLIEAQQGKGYFVRAARRSRRAAKASEPRRLRSRPRPARSGRCRVPRLHSRLGVRG